MASDGSLDRSTSSSSTTSSSSSSSSATAACQHPELLLAGIEMADAARAAEPQSDCDEFKADHRATPDSPSNDRDSSDGEDADDTLPLDALSHTFVLRSSYPTPSQSQTTADSPVPATSDVPATGDAAASTPVLSHHLHTTLFDPLMHRSMHHHRLSSSRVVDSAHQPQTATGGEDTTDDIDFDTYDSSFLRELSPPSFHDFSPDEADLEELSSATARPAVQPPHFLPTDWPPAPTTTTSTTPNTMTQSPYAAARGVSLQQTTAATTSTTAADTPRGAVYGSQQQQHFARFAYPLHEGNLLNTTTTTPHLPPSLLRYRPQGNTPPAAAAAAAPVAMTTAATSTMPSPTVASPLYTPHAYAGHFYQPGHTPPPLHHSPLGHPDSALHLPPTPHTMVSHFDQHHPLGLYQQQQQQQLYSQQQQLPWYPPQLLHTLQPLHMQGTTFDPGHHHHLRHAPPRLSSSQWQHEMENAEEWMHRNRSGSLSRNNSLLHNTSLLSSHSSNSSHGYPPPPPPPPPAPPSSTVESSVASLSSTMTAGEVARAQWIQDQMARHPFSRSLPESSATTTTPMAPAERPDATLPPRPRKDSMASTGSSNTRTSSHSKDTSGDLATSTADSATLDDKQCRRCDDDDDDDDSDRADYHRPHDALFPCLLVSTLLLLLALATLYSVCLVLAYEDCKTNRLGSPVFSQVSPVPRWATSWNLVHKDAKLVPLPSVHCHLPRNLSPVLASTVQFLDLIKHHRYVSLEQHRVQLNDLRDQLHPHQDASPHLRSVINAVFRVSTALTSAEESLAEFQIRLVNSVYRLSSHMETLQSSLSSTAAKDSATSTATATTANASTDGDKSDAWRSFWHSALIIASLRAEDSPGLAVLSTQYKAVLIQEIDQLIASSTSAHADYEKVYISLSTLLREIAPAMVASRSSVADYERAGYGSSASGGTAIYDATAAAAAAAAAAAGSASDGTNKEGGAGAAYGLRWIFRNLFSVGTERYDNLVRTVRDLERLAEETKLMEGKVLHLIDELKWKRRRLEAIGKVAISPSASALDASPSSPAVRSGMATRLDDDDSDGSGGGGTGTGDDDMVSIAPSFFADRQTVQKFFVDKDRIKHTIDSILAEMHSFPKDLDALRRIERIPDGAAAGR
ncbi:hypothetical protein RI367_008630 [Sorochytrium milnesiophthora]